MKKEERNQGAGMLGPTRSNTGPSAKAHSGVGDGSRPWLGAGHHCDQLSPTVGVLLIGLSRPLRLSELVWVMAATATGGAVARVPHHGRGAE